MLREIGEGLARPDREVHIFASIPSYLGKNERCPKNEMLGQLHVRRCWVFQENKKNPALRVVNVFLYCLSLFIHVLRLRPDVVTASTFPPVIAAWSAGLAARLVGARFIYHMQDIHPEVSEFSGSRLGRGFVARALRWLDNKTLCRADTIILLSQDMKETLMARGLGPLPIKVINNFSLDVSEDTARPPADMRKNPEKRRVIFAGNMGQYQNLPLLAEGVATCFPSHPDLELFFLGEGAMLPELKARWEGHPQVRFGPFLPFAQARELIAEADVGLASLAPNIYRVAYPSKVLTYSAMGLRVLALVEPNSHLARDLEAAQQGAAPTDQTPEAIGQALERVLSMPRPQGNSVTKLVETHTAWAEVIDCDS